MINTLQAIQNTENEAVSIIKTAEDKAVSIVNTAKETRSKEIATLKTELEENQTQQTNQQKEILAKLYKDILKRSENKIKTITENDRKGDAVKFILDNI